MSRQRKLLAKVLAGAHNIRFEELCRLAESFGYRLDRVSGSHTSTSIHRRIVR